MARSLMEAYRALQSRFSSLNGSDSIIEPNHIEMSPARKPPSRQVMVKAKRARSASIRRDK